ncbi:hypothetical protein QFC19_005837 [Naganishia cerealis]|uniref:Uncharacterized protein n=1 Tax=Naganishia cerealis TaxID=610337 RepID=A0ACC2VLZ5_9TREE|nr:hypothetical protein QFC19_005837 [Naganishia cerealis]
MAEAVGALDESFLPQIIGIFYATFHPKQGPIVPYKVPENLISHNEQGFESSQGPNSRRGSFDPNSLLSSTSQAPNRSADELEDDGLLQEDVLAFRRGSIARRSTTGKSEDGKEDSRLLKPDETPISSTSRDSSLSSHPNWVQTPSATSTAPTTSLSYSLQEASPTAFPTVPEPLLSARSSLHTCSAPGSAITSREQSPSVPIPSLPSGDASKALVTADDARAKRLGAFTSNKVREADTYPLHAGNGYCGPRSSLDESDASDREDAHGRGRPTAVQNMIRCASESPSSGLERTGHHQSHIHVVNIASTTHSSSDSTLINGIGEDSRRRGSFGQLVSASLDSRRRLASRSRTRATGGTAAAAAAGPGNGGARTSSVSPNRLGRFRGMRSSSPAGIQGSYRVPSTSASAGGRDMSMQAATGPQTLLDFSQISEYIIGKSALKHRLVTNQFIWNLAFVFDRRSDLSGFEPVVRKCGRIFRACELDSQYLTQRSTRANIQNVIDQMFEDLNSYSETSITIDGINYLELKLFPFYRKFRVSDEVY